MSQQITHLMRPDLRGAQAYQAAEPDFSRLRLHANESPWQVGEASASDGSMSGLNRYPPVRPLALEQQLAALYGVREQQLLATRGSDDGIDLLLRGFCRAGLDGIVVQPPCFTMYETFARVQGASVTRVPLSSEHEFALRPDELSAACTEHTRLVFVCSPNNPTGTLQPPAQILQMCEQLRGRAMVVVDEAYIEFAGIDSLAAQLDSCDNLIVLRTLSKAYGLAGARCGAVLAHPLVIALLQSIAPPYAMPEPVIRIVCEGLARHTPQLHTQRMAALAAERSALREALAQLPAVKKIWPSAANFLLVEFSDPLKAVQQCREGNVLVRHFTHDPVLAESVRITVGTQAQNAKLLQCLRGGCA